MGNGEVGLVYPRNAVQMNQIARLWNKDSATNLSLGLEEQNVLGNILERYCAPSLVRNNNQKCDFVNNHYFFSYIVQI